MPPILNPAPPWEAHRTEYILLWHGCTVFDKNNIEAYGIDLTRCRFDTDFGRGFYTTTVERQARQWAWARFFAWQRANPTLTGNQPVLLRFRVRRFNSARMARKLDKGLDGLLSLQFVLGDYTNEDYWSLVQHCRQSTPLTLNHHRRVPGDWYDVVFGPVSAFWEQRVTMDDADQISFHTTEAIGLMNDLIESGKKGNSDDYSWLPVVP